MVTTVSAPSPSLMSLAALRSPSSASHTNTSPSTVPVTAENVTRLPYAKEMPSSLTHYRKEQWEMKEERMELAYNQNGAQCPTPWRNNGVLAQKVVTMAKQKGILKAADRIIERPKQSDDSNRFPS